MPVPRLVERVSPVEAARQTHAASATARPAERPAMRKREPSPGERESRRWQDTRAIEKRAPVRRGPANIRRPATPMPGLYFPGMEMGIDRLLLEGTNIAGQPILFTPRMTTVGDLILVEPLPVDLMQVQPPPATEHLPVSSVLPTSTSLLIATAELMQPEEADTMSTSTRNTRGFGANFVFDLLSAAVQIQQAQLDRIVEGARRQRIERVLLAKRRVEETLDILAWNRAALARQVEEKLVN